MTRAKVAFYCIGNLTFLASKSDLWSDILQQAKERKIYGEGIPLSCGIKDHVDSDIVVKESADFDKHRPDGGCLAGCEIKLSCGHSCKKKCHRDDHGKCESTCNKTIPTCSHRCLSTCHHPNECKLCKTEIEQKVPNCDHMILFNCGKAPTSADCTHECGKTLSCNHICQKQCNKPCLPCEELVEISTQCEHKAIVNIECCNQVKDFLLHKYCNQTCNKKLSCKHSCKGKCSECYYGYLHTPCQEPCKNLLICRHECQGLCSEYCPPCFKPCEIRCTHSKCSNPCYLRCDPCNEICDWKCEHIKCDQICSEICQREPCDAHCQKIVCSEGHKCVGFCGETCPPCYKCNKSGYHNFLAIGDESEEFDDFENCRFVKFDCMHVFEVNQITSVIKNKIDDGEIQMIICPICSIKQQFCKRFYREIKEATININIAKMQWNRNEE